MFHGDLLLWVGQGRGNKSGDTSRAQSQVSIDNSDVPISIIDRKNNIVDPLSLTYVHHQLRQGPS